MLSQCYSKALSNVFQDSWGTGAAVQAGENREVGARGKRSREEGSPVGGEK